MRRRKHGFGGPTSEHADSVRTFRELSERELAFARDRLSRGDCFGGSLHLITAIRERGAADREAYYAGYPADPTGHGFMLGVSAAMSDFALCSRRGEAGEVRRARQRVERRAEREWLRRHEG